MTADSDIVAAYQTVLPRVIHVALKHDGDNVIAIINKIDDTKVKGLLITEAKNDEELVSNVNDIVYAYVEMPEHIRPYYGNIFAPKDLKKNAKELTLIKA